MNRLGSDFCFHVALYYKNKWLEHEQHDLDYLVDLGGTELNMSLIPSRITLKDKDFDKFTQNLDWSAHWKEFFKKHNTEDFKEFMEDREQDTPRDIDF